MDAASAFRELVFELRERVARLSVKKNAKLDSYDTEYGALKRATETDEFYNSQGGFGDAPFYKQLNRYSNIIPYDRNRVALEYVEGVEGSDYINASFMDGAVLNDHAYIATQGPMPDTYASFWRMVWEQECGFIVMLTKEFEGNQQKCSVYWPQNAAKEAVFDDIRVTFDGQENLSPYLIRRQITVHQHRNGSRKVVHLQYTGWPDFGVPSSAATIRMIAREIDAYRASYNAEELPPPVIIHCSAGAGRTGTFIAIHKEITRIHGILDGTIKPPPNGSLQIACVKDTVKKLRTERVGSVQSADQYRFIFTAVLEEAEQLLMDMTCGSKPAQKTLSAFKGS